ncbi:aspartyl protease family protein [Tenacibaculum sp. C7A-26P2]|uniref:retropepsin-like aspartic protease n=1 Tax=Tenacibaculum sp. C7A-26P2 TaxID=3447504 RepID=UPI003F849E9F
MNKKIILLILILATVSNASSQFNFINNSEKEVIEFRLINNLIVFPLQVNGKNLSFILDTGVRKTILFNLNQRDSLELKNTQKILIRGLGAGQPVEAIHSKGNEIRTDKILGFNQNIFVILNDTFNLSSKMGTTIHGIIGYDLLQDIILKINYKNRLLTLINPKKYEPPKCRSCERLDIEFYRKKPFINIYVSTDSVNKNIPVKMLIDSGGSDAIWMFEGTDKNIITPKKYFSDVLGEGLSGIIYGKRSRVNKVKIGKYVIEKPTASFLDTLSTYNARNFKERNGSIGGGILKRFKVWIDYPNKKIILKKTGSLKKGFYYNMSGIHVEYNGLDLVREKKERGGYDQYGSKSNGVQIVSLASDYIYRFKPSFRIQSVVKDSPADLAGVKSGDIIKKINNKFGYEYTLESISELFHTKPNKKIVLVVEREGGGEMKYRFHLKPRI